MVSRFISAVYWAPVYTNWENQSAIMFLSVTLNPVVVILKRVGTSSITAFLLLRIPHKGVGTNSALENRSKSFFSFKLAKTHAGVVIKGVL